MSYSQITNAGQVEREIQWLEYQREHNKQRVQEDFTALMKRLERDKNNRFENVMKTLKTGEPVKSTWADMIEDAEANGWQSGWPEKTKAKRYKEPNSWVKAVKG